MEHDEAGRCRDGWEGSFGAIEPEPQSKTTSATRRQLNEGLVLEILISDRHPLPFVLALIEGRRTDIFTESAYLSTARMNGIANRAARGNP